MQSVLLKEREIVRRRSGYDKRFLLMSSSLLVDRVLLHTELVSTLKNWGDVRIWAASATDANYSQLWREVDAEVECLPAVMPFREFPYNYLRRLNEFAWDYRLRSPSRMSIRRHVRDKKLRLSVRVLKPPARIVSALGSERWLEDKIEQLLLTAPIRSVEGMRRMLSYKPTVLLSTGLFQFEQPALYEAAHKLGIPTLAYIPSWDNITTKNRMIYKYDGFVVWSEQTKRELREFYPATRDTPVYIVGAPQFDIFFEEKFYQTREEFCRQQNLDPGIPIVVYALGSPNFLQEHYGALEFAKRVAGGEFGRINVLVRPHPIHDNAELRSVFNEYEPHVRLQESPNAGRDLVRRSQDSRQIVEWINTFRHADVVINLSSTVTIDAAIFDRPIVNLDFDPQPSRADQQLIKDVNHKWDHFKPIAESGGVWSVNDFDEMVLAVKTYLKRPELHRDERRWIAEYVCGYLDGKCGQRMAAAINDFAESVQPTRVHTAARQRP